MSRRAREEMPFGSDSFLDVLANIVGILIILIVAAAARMGRVPDLSLVINRSADPETSAPVVPPAEPERAEFVVIPESDEPPAEITEEMSAIAGQLTMWSDKAGAADAKLKNLQSAYHAARLALVDEESQAAKRTDQLQQAQLRVARLEEALGDRRQALNGLLAEF